MTLDILQYCAKGDIEYLRGWIEVEEKPENLLDLKSNDGKSAMEIAACFGKQDVLEELQKLGGSLGYLSPRGYSLLHWSACWGHLETVKYLINAGVTVEQRNVHGENSLDLARRYNQTKCASYIEKAGKLQDLKNLALSYKDIIADPEKNLGRFNKEDKISGNRNCDEKLDWIEQNRDIASLEQIINKIEELQNQLRNTMLKLSDT